MTMANFYFVCNEPAMDAYAATFAYLGEQNVVSFCQPYNFSNPYKLLPDELITTIPDDHYIMLLRCGGAGGVQPDAVWVTLPSTDVDPELGVSPTQLLASASSFVFLPKDLTTHSDLELNPSPYESFAHFAERYIATGGAGDEGEYTDMSLAHFFTALQINALHCEPVDPNTACPPPPRPACGPWPKSLWEQFPDSMLANLNNIDPGHQYYELLSELDYITQQPDN